MIQSGMKQFTILTHAALFCTAFIAMGACGGGGTTATPRPDGNTSGGTDGPTTGTPDAPPVDAPPPTVPDAPQNVQGSIGDELVVLTWSAPATNGGSPLLGYVVTVDPGGMETMVSDTTATISGLTNGVEYSFVVAATNAVGRGATSPVAALRPGSAPDEPTDVTATPGNGRVTLNWTVPDDNGRAITSYSVVSTPDGVMASGLAPPLEVTGLRNHIDYTFQLVATNELGMSLPVTSPSARPFLPVCTNTVTYQLASNTPVGDLPIALASGRFDSDAYPDVAVSNFSGNSVTVLRGDGQGNFTAGAPIPVGSAPRGVVAQDFNGDAHLDLAVALSGEAALAILLGDGQGNFTLQATKPATGSAPFDLVAADFNEDGYADLAVANNAVSSMSLLFGNGQGGFDGAISNAMPSTSIAIDVGFINGDAHLDVMIAHGSISNLSLRFGNGDGTFSNGEVSAGQGQRDVRIGDVDGNGRGDMNYTRGSSLFSRRLNLISSWGAVSDTNVGQAPVSLELVDLDNDGDLDVATSNYGNGQVVTAMNDGNGTFSAGATIDIATGSQPRMIHGVDVDLDGDNDLVVARGFTDDVTTLIVGCSE